MQQLSEGNVCRKRNHRKAQLAPAALTPVASYCFLNSEALFSELQIDSKLMSKYEMSSQGTSKAHINVCVCVCMCVYICIYMYVHIYIHTVVSVYVCVLSLTGTALCCANPTKCFVSCKLSDAGAVLCKATGKVSAFGSYEGLGLV